MDRYAKEYGERIALTEWDNNISYERLDRLVSIRAGYLKYLGLNTGDFVLLQLPNSIEFVITFFAIVRSKGVPILCLPANRENELEGITKLSKPKFYIYSKNAWGIDYEQLGNNLAQKFDCIETIISVEMICDNENDKEYPFYSDTVSADQIALFLLSGGTTNVPKLIPRTHADYMYVARKSAEKCKMTREQVANIKIDNNKCVDVA